MKYIVLILSLFLTFTSLAEARAGGGVSSRGSSFRSSSFRSSSSSKVSSSRPSSSNTSVKNDSSNGLSTGMWFIGWMVVGSMLSGNDSSSNTTINGSPNDYGYSGASSFSDWSGTSPPEWPFIFYPDDISWENSISSVFGDIFFWFFEMVKGLFIPLLWLSFLICLFTRKKFS